jgi:Skp family chaperone for outer membrane proteins
MRISCTVVAIVVAASLMTGAWAQTAPAPVKVAVVDLARVSNEYARLAEMRTEIQGWYQQQQKYLEELANGYSFLTEEHFKEVLDILSKPRPLAQPLAKRRDELQKLNEEKEARFLELQAKVDRTDKERDEFNQLQEINQARNGDIDKVAEDLRNQFMDKKTKAETDLTDAITQAVKDVATGAGYVLVLNKMGVMYGGDDITDVVIHKLNGSTAAPKPATGGAPGGPGGQAPAGAPPEGGAPGGGQ